MRESMRTIRSPATHISDSHAEPEGHRMLASDDVMPAERVASRRRRAQERVLVCLMVRLSKAAGGSGLIRMLAAGWDGVRRRAGRLTPCFAWKPAQRLLVQYRKHFSAAGHIIDLFADRVRGMATNRYAGV
jgi:hypothetical protein